MKDKTIFLVDSFSFSSFNSLIYLISPDYLYYSIDCFGEHILFESSLLLEFLFDKELEKPLFLFIAFRSNEFLISGKWLEDAWLVIAG